MNILTVIILLVLAVIIFRVARAVVQSSVSRFSIIMLSLVLVFTFPGLVLIWNDDYSKLGELCLTLAGLLGMIESYVRHRKEDTGKPKDVVEL